PYGETSFGSFAKKRYRFTGKERDEESGLNYFGMRYYANWLGKWPSCDPAGMLNSVNLYRFVRNNPLVFKDPAGLQEVNSSDAGAPPPETIRDAGATDISGSPDKPVGFIGPPLPPKQATKPTVAELRQERWEAAKAGMQNRAIDIAADTVTLSPLLANPV